MPGLACPVLCLLFACAITCIWCSGLDRTWQCLLSGAALLEAYRSLQSIRGFRLFRLGREDSGVYHLEHGRKLIPISGVHWQDFGYLAIQHYLRDGRPRSAVWWLMLMPEPQLRQLRLWMNAAEPRPAGELPSVLLNPVS